MTSRVEISKGLMAAFCLGALCCSWLNAEGVGSNEDERVEESIRATREAQKKRDSEIVRPRAVPATEPITPTPLDPGVMRNYDYVTEHKKDWRAAEKEFPGAYENWRARKMCSVEFFKIADRCSPKFQNGIPNDMYSVMHGCGWRSLYFELKPLPEEGFKPYCNDPECAWCCANDKQHIEKIQARVKRRQADWAEQDKKSGEPFEPVEPEIVKPRHLVPVPDPMQEPQQKPKRKRGRDNTALLTYV